MSEKSHISHTIGLEQKQKQRLTPLQIQEIHILEFPLLELEQRIEQELIENPGLEVDDGKDSKEPETEDGLDDSFDNDPLDNDHFDFKEYTSDDDSYDDGGYAMPNQSNSKGEAREEIPFSVGPSLHEYLLTQLGMLEISEFERKVAQYIIGNIDTRGYLRSNYEKLVDDLAFSFNITVSDEQMQSLIKLIQDSFDPAGIAASDLQECLLLQLKRKPESEITRLAITIVEKRYKELAAHQYKKIRERYSITDEQLQAVLDEIQHLTPNPGGPWSESVYSVSTVIPDFIIDVDINNNYVGVRLNNGDIPELKISRSFKESLQLYQKKTEHSKSEKDYITFIKDRINAANWFIGAIEQRNETLLKTMRAIVSLQKEFFLTGEPANIKPMILKDVADRTGYDVSTISRVSNQKYAQTPYGILKLRTFFSESLLDNDGNEVATKAIKTALSEIINDEDKRHPYNDDELVVLLKEKGYTIARRTIAKYRAMLGIPIARHRKSI